MAETLTKAWKPDRHIHLDWRGAQLRAINGALATLRVQAEAWAVRDYDVATVALPAAVTLGDALIVRVSGAWPYSIAEIRTSRFVRGAPSDQVGAMARGEFWPGILSYAMFNESDFWWEQS